MTEGYWITTQQHAECETALERLRAAEREAWKTVAAGTKEIERLRAELAVAKALLRESVQEAFDDAYRLHPEGVDLLRRIHALLEDES